MKNLILLLLLALNLSADPATDVPSTNSVQITITLTPQDQWAIAQIRAASTDTNITSLSITNLQIAWFDQSRTNQTADQIKQWLANGVNVFKTAPVDKQAQVLQALSITNAPPSQ